MKEEIRAGERADEKKQLEVNKKKKTVRKKWRGREKGVNPDFPERGWRRE